MYKNKNYRCSKKNIKRKRVDYFKIIELIACLTAILSFFYVVVSSVLNNIYQQERARYFSVPLDFFSLNIMEYSYVIVILCIPLIVILYFSKNLSNNLKISLCIEIVLLEVFYFIMGMYLWSWELDSFFSSWECYKGNPIKFVNIVTICGIIVIIAINFFLIIKKKSKNSLLLAAVFYLILLTILILRKHDLYFEVFLKKPKSQERYFVIGSFDGDYAIASGEVENNYIIFSNKKVRIINTEEIKNFESRMYRKSVLK